MLVVYRNLLGESHPATGERPEGMLGRRSGRVDGARSESGAAREQAVIGEIVEGFHHRLLRTRAFGVWRKVTCV